MDVAPMWRNGRSVGARTERLPTFGLQKAYVDAESCIDLVVWRLASWLRRDIKYMQRSARLSTIHHSNILGELETAVL
jgi:hypothetical protein